MRKHAIVSLLVLSLVVPFPAGAQKDKGKKAPPPPPTLPAPPRQPADWFDYEAIAKIKEEGLGSRTSKVMEIESYLTDVYGPRLTGSPNTKNAGDWAVKKLTEWGLANAHLESWGPFGRGWSNQKCYLQVTSPNPFPLIGYPSAWTPGTNGLVNGDITLATIEKDEDFEKYKGKLKGKFVMTSQMREVNPHFDPQAQRYTDKQLEELTQAQIQLGGGGRRAVNPQFAQFQQLQLMNNKIRKFLVDEGAALWLQPGRGDGGTVFVQSGGSRDPKDAPAPPTVVLGIEYYGRIFRTLEKNIPMTMEANVQSTFHDAEPNSFNVIAEIPGTDPTLSSELVMLGAHFDSWHSGTGATDNAAGSAVMMEAVRILKAIGLKNRRTIRIGLWTGEEQGLLGSRAYVKDHFADRADMKPKPEHEKFSGYFNIDNGTGKVRGIYLQGNDSIASLFKRWMEPFGSLGMNTLTIRNTGGTDHLSFDAVGLPGFQFIQDEVEYDSRTHHSNMDVYERIQESDMRQIATIVASFVYLTANRDDKLPRKPLPKPATGGGPGM